MSRSVGSAEVDGSLDGLRQLALALAALTASSASTADAGTSAAGSAAESLGDAPRLAIEDLPPLITVSRASAALGISRASGYRYAACGDLPTIRMGGRLYVVTARLKACLEEE